ncbi:hypothetical protein DPMN_033672 [Dreissena polymorpha]|uniref:Uncharacterized protein n=1 Tax=Dreissena polymorpha TaxID=45954 RepID=A0A9D4M644_DREPO|nr:hypothetical protein DPMN_033672 [Dreissena polymorpha]
MMEAKKFSDTTDKSYNVLNEVTFKSTNVVYVVHCERCKTFVYVGETGDTLYQRHLLNLSRIRTGHNGSRALLHKRPERRRLPDRDRENRYTIDEDMAVQSDAPRFESSIIDGSNKRVLVEHDGVGMPKHLFLDCAADR